jgi:hypothetical protein
MSGPEIVVIGVAAALVAALVNVIIVRENGGCWTEATESAGRTFRRTLSLCLLMLALYFGPDALDALQQHQRI